MSKTAFILALALLAVQAHALPRTDDVVPEVDGTLVEETTGGSYEIVTGVSCGLKGNCGDNNAMIHNGNYHMKGTVEECEAKCNAHSICDGFNMKMATNDCWFRQSTSCSSMPSDSQRNCYTKSGTGSLAHRCPHFPDSFV